MTLMRNAWAVRDCSLTLGLLLILALPAAGIARSTTKPAPGPDEVQWWKGAIALPTTPMDIVVVFRPADEHGQYTAKIDIPVQGALGLDLQDVALTATELRFTIGPPANAVFTAQRAADAKTATGELNQNGMTFPLSMQRITEQEAKSIGPKRPQTPQPPFPYTQRDVTYKNPDDQTILAGTLTIPAGDGPHPAVLLLTGSGAQDRDETIFNHKPFFVIADHLARLGIAVLRVDDRGIGGSSGSVSQSTSEDFAGDALAGVRFLMKQPEIDARRIGLVGHSEGGLVAPLVAARSEHVACIVLLAGPGLPGDDILRLQTEALLRAAGLPEEAIAKELKAHRVMMEAMVSGANEQAVREALRALLKVQLARSGGGEASPEEFDALVEQHLSGLQSPWMRAFVRLDPRDALRRVKCPVLALNGSLDLQVPPKENLPEIEQALHAGGNHHVTVKELPDLNHLFQEARTGLVGEYATLQQTFAPAALTELSDWLCEQFKLAH